MIKTCNADYWQFMESAKPTDAPCGRTFDDAECSTICPHDTLPPPLSEQAQAELLGAITGNRPVTAEVLAEIVKKYPAEPKMRSTPISLLRVRARSAS